MSNYAGLITDIQTWMENVTTELSNVIPSIIAASEYRLSRDLTVYGFQVQTTGNWSVGNGIITRPSDLLYVSNLSFVSGTTQTVLQLKTLEYQFEAFPDSSYRAAPQFYAVNNATQFIVAPLPDAAYGWTMNYYAKPAALTSTNQTNWFTTWAYDALLAACLADAYRYVLDDRQTSGVNMWEGKYNVLVKALNALETRAERDDYQVPAISADNR